MRSRTVAIVSVALLLSLQESPWAFGRDLYDLTEDDHAREFRTASLHWHDGAEVVCDFLSAKRDTCGVTCTARPINVTGFELCLEKAFGSRQRADGTGAGAPTANLVWPDSSDYDKAREGALNANRYPAAVVYAESTSDVQDATKCAYMNGYHVSARGRGHSLQALSVISGALVIDMTGMCNPEDFVIDKTAEGPHILDGSRYIATIKAGAGCTNAVMLHAVHKHFPAKDGAMALIGSCPSVGITGYTLGGGMGDVTPYTGFAADLLQELEMVLYDGEVVRASKNEHPDLYWASRGGGGGNGVVTSLTFKVVKSPAPAKSEEPRFTQLFINYSDGKEAMPLLQKFLYSSKGGISSKYGGNVIYANNGLEFTCVYLGHWKDAMRELRDAHLLDEELLSDTTLYGGKYSTLWTNYTEICGGSDVCSMEDIPRKGVDMREYASYGEVEARVICRSTRLQPLWTARNKDICKDLGVGSVETIGGPYCNQGRDPLTGKVDPERTELNCESQHVMEQLLLKAGDPGSFINRHADPSPIGFTIPLNGLLLPPLEKKTLQGLSSFNISFSHLGHGASLKVPPGETAFPWRNSGLLTSTIEQKAINILLKDRTFKNDVNNLQGFYNYLSPEIPNWRRFYFGKNWERLTEVKHRYDPLNVFGKPLTAELPVDSKKGILKRFFGWLASILNARKLH